MRRRGGYAARVLGISLSGFAVATALLAFAAWVMRDPWSGFALSSVLAATLGIPAWSWGRSDGHPSRREALGSVLLLWLALPLLGMIPFAVTGGMGWLDAWFEATSGFTATGATAILDFSKFTPTLFIWRSFSQWVGGIGIIALFVAVFPQLAIAGRQLFVAEMPGPTEEQFTPRLRQTARTLLSVYVLMTVVAGLAYLAAGLTPFQALTHAMTTVSAAGFSPEARSFEGFGAAVQWVSIVFMTLAGANFVLQFRLLTGRPGALFRDAEFRAYLAIFALSGAALTLLLWPLYGGDSVRHALFQAISIMTTTGYASVDFGTWGTPAQTVLVLLMFVGGSAGSAAGGIKVIRLLIIAKNTAREVRRVLHPKGVLPVRVGDRIIPEDVLRSVSAFVTLYAFLFAFLVTSLALMGVEFTTAFTASIATLGNVGPGLGAVGPMESFAVLPNPAKALLTFAMYAGRLEVIAVFVMFTPDVWRTPRPWRA